MCRSNMNRLCWEIERWERDFRWKRTYKDFDYNIMIDDSITFVQENYDKIKDIYLDFCKTMKALYSEKSVVQREYGVEIHWQYYYDLYRNKCLQVCPETEFANYAVMLCYVENPTNSRNKNFIWNVAGNGVIQNIKQVPVKLPMRNPDGEFEYLGRKYSMEEFVI